MRARERHSLDRFALSSCVYIINRCIEKHGSCYTARVQGVSSARRVESRVISDNDAF